MRDTTERPEGLESRDTYAGRNRRGEIYSACKMLLDNIEQYQKMCQAP